MNKNKKIFSPLMENKKDIEKKYFVFDVETWGLNARPKSFALGCIYGKNYKFQTNNLEELKNELCSEKFNNKIIFAHNAQYDLNTVFNNIITGLDVKAVFNGGTFIFANNTNENLENCSGRISFADSLNIAKTSVENMGEILNYPKLKTPEKFFSKKVEKLNPEDYDYCMRDCEVVYNFLKKSFLFAGNVKLTLASLSMDLFRRKYLKKPIWYDKNLTSVFFSSYFGGRTEAIILGETNGIKYDINSMYPFVMEKMKFPNPNKLKEIKNPSLKKLKFLINTYEGCCEISLHHDESLELGVLPLKYENRTLFPVGFFSGTYNFNELRYALEIGAIEILKCKKVIYSSSENSIFKGFINDLYNKRISAKNEADKYIVKIMMNSLYGKFAQREKFERTYYEKMPIKLIDEYRKKNIKYEIFPFSHERQDLYIEVEKKAIDKYVTLPIYSSYITSEARILLHKGMKKYFSSLLYVDTDCLIVTKEIKKEDIDKIKLGKYKLEAGNVVYISGLKNYSEIINGKITKKSKGIPKNSIEISPNTFEYKKMVKSRESLRRKIPAGTFAKVIKTNSNIYTKREILGNYTVPIKFNSKEKPTNYGNND